MRLFVIVCCSLLFSCAVFAKDQKTHYLPDSREQVPAALNNSYFGMGVGYPSIPYTNSYLINNIKAGSFTYPTTGLNVYIGHYFNPYLAVDISLMRPVQWVYANNVPGTSGRHSIWVSLFGVSLRPTLPVTKAINLYALAGLGIISRHGFLIGNTTAIPSTDLTTFITGGGVTYAFTPSWHLNLGLEYALERPAAQQPHILYSYAGFYYLFHTRQLPAYYTTHYLFHKNLIQLGGFSTDIFNPGVNKYFSVHYLPIFWTGQAKTRNGVIAMYQRNVFHTHKMFSLDVGTSVSSYHSAVNNTNFQAFSIFPEIRVWLIRSNPVDFYFLYSVAGPSYITATTIDNVYIGGHFSFQDLLGFGFFLGSQKKVNVDFRIGHYSNGNLLPNNPGIQVPLTISMGYAF